MLTLKPQANVCDASSAMIVNGDEAPKLAKAKDSVLRKASDIRFVRSRMFYAKPSINAKGSVRLGIRHIRMSFTHALWCGFN
jgi:hypothetical protein